MFWDEGCQERMVLRQLIRSDTNHRRKIHVRNWIIVLFVYAIGAEITVGEFSGYPFSAVFFGIGFGVAVSIGFGTWLCRLGPTHQRLMNEYIWFKLLYLLHTPWLLIGPCTALGSAGALIARFVDHENGESFWGIIVLVEFALWVILIFTATVLWGRRYNKQRERLGLNSTRKVHQLHTYFALCIWFGSAFVGLMGGVLGVMFMDYLFSGDRSFI